MHSSLGNAPIVGMNRVTQFHSWLINKPWGQLMWWTKWGLVRFNSAGVHIPYNSTTADAIKLWDSKRDQFSSFLEAVTEYPVWTEQQRRGPYYFHNNQIYWFLRPKYVQPAERLPNVKKTHWAHNLIPFNQVKTF